MTTTTRKATKATTRKGRAVLFLLAQAGAHLLLIGQEHGYVLAGKEHIYVCNDVYIFLHSQEWISQPTRLGETTDILEATVTPEGYRMLAIWQQAANGASQYQQLMFEEIIELFSEAPAKSASQQYQQLMLEENYELPSQEPTPLATEEREQIQLAAEPEPEQIQPVAEAATAPLAAEPERDVLLVCIACQSDCWYSQAYVVDGKPVCEHCIAIGRYPNAGNEPTTQEHAPLAISIEPEPSHQEPEPLTAEESQAPMERERKEETSTQEPTAPATRAATEQPSQLTCQERERDPDAIKPGDIILIQGMAALVKKVNRVTFGCEDLQLVSEKSGKPWRHTFNKNSLEWRLYTAAEWSVASQTERDKLTGKHPIKAIPHGTWVKASRLGRSCLVRVLECYINNAYVDIIPLNADGTEGTLYSTYVSYATIEIESEPEKEQKGEAA